MLRLSLRRDVGIGIAHGEARGHSAILIAHGRSGRPLPQLEMADLPTQRSDSALSADEIHAHVNGRLQRMIVPMIGRTGPGDRALRWHNHGNACRNRLAGSDRVRDEYRGRELRSMVPLDVGVVAQPRATTSPNSWNSRTRRSYHEGIAAIRAPPTSCNRGQEARQAPILGSKRVRHGPSHDDPRSVPKKCRGWRTKPRHDVYLVTTASRRRRERDRTAGRWGSCRRSWCSRA